MNSLKQLRAEYEAMPADTRNGAAGLALAKEIQRRSKPRKVAILAAGCSHAQTQQKFSACDQTLIDITSDPRRIKLHTGQPLEVKRSGNNRNLPCPCGSGRKFKKCCVDNIAPIHITP